DQMAEHPLRRDIVATQLVNEAVNRGGVSFFFRTMEETEASTAEVLRAYIVVRDVFGLDDAWQGIESLDNKVPVDAQTTAYLQIRQLLDRAVRWLVLKRPAPIDVEGEIERLRPSIRQLLPELGTLFRGGERQALVDNKSALVDLGLPGDQADLVTRLKYSLGLLDVVEAAHTTGRDLGEIADVYFVLSEHFCGDDLLSWFSALPRNHRGQPRARRAPRSAPPAARAGWTAQVLPTPPAHADAQARVAAWEDANYASIAQVRKAIGELYDCRADITVLSV